MLHCISKCVISRVCVAARGTVEGVNVNLHHLLWSAFSFRSTLWLVKLLTSEAILE